ncbi:MAG TPA: sensor histidine kinase [Micromonosporaceae bacterium]
MHALGDLGTAIDPPRAHLCATSAAEAAHVQRQINHDINHEVATITLLASLLCAADDVGPRSRRRAEEILGETRLLQSLLAADRGLADQVAGRAGLTVPVPLDLIANDVIAAVRLSTTARISLDAGETYARVDSLTFWRALRNLVGNAVRAAGPDGSVWVRARTEGGWALVQIEDDGPGFGECPPGSSSLGLGIVRDLADAANGELEIRAGATGGCCAVLRLPAATRDGRWAEPDF